MNSGSSLQKKENFVLHNVITLCSTRFPKEVTFTFVHSFLLYITSNEVITMCLLFNELFTAALAGITTFNIILIKLIR